MVMVNILTFFFRASERIMYKKIAVVAACLAIGMLSAQSTKLKFAAGFVGGTYYKIGKSLSKLSKTKVTTLETKGSQENIKLVAEGKADLGLVQLDILNNSVKVGDELRSKLKVILPIYREEVHILSHKKYTSYKQLKGKTISVGSSFSGTSESANIILIAMKLKGRVKIDRSETGLALKRLKRKEIDAVFIVAGAPIDLLARDRFKYNLIPFKGTALAMLTGPYFPYKKSTVKRKQYKWLKKNIQTISVASVLIVNSSMSDAQVSSLVKKIIKGKKKLARSHRKWNELNVKYARKFLKALGKGAHPAALTAL